MQLLYSTVLTAGNRLVQYCTVDLIHLLVARKSLLVGRTLSYYGLANQGKLVSTGVPAIVEK